MKKINKKGFTLTELLATIAILALVATIATPAVIGISNSIKENMYKSKVKLLLQAAKLYGEDNEDLAEISVKDLCEKDYINKDDNASDKTECVLNPKDNESMGNCKINITRNNGRVITSWKYWGDSQTNQEGCN